MRNDLGQVYQSFDKKQQHPDLYHWILLFGFINCKLYRKQKIKPILNYLKIKLS